MKPGKHFVGLYATSIILLFSMCKSPNRAYTIDDVYKDTLTEGHTYYNSYEVEKRNNQLFNKYIYSNKSDRKAAYNIISLSIGNIERYTGQLPEVRAHRLNEAPIIFRNHWRQIEPLYLKVLAATRTAIKDHPESSGLYKHSADVKCTINDVHGAIQDMLMAINLNPTDGDSYEMLGYYYELNNEFTKACESLRKARDLGEEIRQSDIEEVCND